MEVMGMEAMIVSCLVLVVAAVALGYAAYSGLFHKINVTTGPPIIGRFTVAYKFFTGRYEYAFQPRVSVLGEICPDKKHFAVWYDDPKKVAPEKLRYILGAILAEEDENPDMETFKKLEEKGFKIYEFPRANRVIKTSFPRKNLLSEVLAAFSVYNKENGLLEESGPIVDVYDRPGAMKYFQAILDHYDDFYVPEAKSAT